MGHVELFVGLNFTSHKVFKQAILAYSIQQHKDLIFLKNDKKQIHLGCAHCPNIEDHSAWQIKSLQPVHSYVRTFENRLITENWLVSEYLDKILRNPRMKPIEIKQDMKERYEIVISDRKCQRAKEKALNAVKKIPIPSASQSSKYGLLVTLITTWLKLSIVSSFLQDIAHSSMLEDIRLSLMERMREKKQLEGKFVGGVSPGISLKLEEAYNEQAKYTYKRHILVC
ncbi:Keratin type II cytoskeletal 72 [Bienertia sinuspersici]